MKNCSAIFLRPLLLYVKFPYAMGLSLVSVLLHGLSVYPDDDSTKPSSPELCSGSGYLGGLMEPLFPCVVS